MAADKKSVQELVAANRELNEYYAEQAKHTASLLNSSKQRAAIEEQIANNARTLAELKKRAAEGDGDALAAIKQIEAQQQKLIANTEKHGKQLRIVKTLRQEINSQLKIGLRYLMDSDKTIKSTILSLGLSGSKADAMRASFEQSAGYVAHLGGSLSDTAAIMQGYADETGKARAMTESMVSDITEIGMGTGLGIEQATKLGAQFEFMGIDARRANEYVQGVVDTTERMGVNTTKVLKDVTTNFKKLSTFTFQKGVKGFAEMAVSAEKTRVSMETALDVAEATRNLETVIELGANLQIMGGEFAKMDPFEWLYMVRNEPDKLNAKISEMTTGLYTFKKNSEGIMEKFISPADRDRLSSVAKSLGISNEEMFEIAQKRLDLNKINQDMAGLGLTGREKELIEGAAFFDSKTGKYQVELAGRMEDISNLTKTQAESFAIEQVSLKARAEEAMTFEKAFKATIEELKATLLPLLKQINTVLAWAREHISPMIEKLTSGDRAWLKVAGMFITAGVLWKGLLQPLAGRIGAGTVGRLGGAIRGTRGLTSAIPGKGPGSSGLAMQRVGIGAGAAGKGAGLSKAGTGAAAAGIGAGIMLAAKGIGEMAEKMALLDKTQIWALPATVLALAAGFWALSPAIIAVGTAGSAGALGLLALGAAVVGIGFGINLATKGIGTMAEGLGSMMESSKGAGEDMMKVGIGIAGMAASMALFGVGALGLIPFAITMGTIAKHSDKIQKVGDAFSQIHAVMSGSKDDWIAIEQAVKNIAGVNVRGGGMLTELANLLKKPLKVQFANKEIAVVSNITMEIDGDKFFQRTYRPSARISKDQEAKAGQGTG